MGPPRWIQVHGSGPVQDWRCHRRRCYVRRNSSVSEPGLRRIVQRLRLVAEVFGGALERQRSTAEIRRLTAEMRHISGVAMMGELTASLAHELNQPLGAVLNNAHAARRLLAAKKPDLGEIGEALDDIVRDNSRAVATIRQLRSLFQRGESQTLPVDIQNIFRDIDRIVGADAREKKIDLRVDVAPPLPVVFGDRTQLTQAVLNLVNNAFDSICAVDEGPREVVLRAGGGEAGRLRVAVCDSGEGIDSKIMPRLFDPFFTTKSTGMGMGWRSCERSSRRTAVICKRFRIPGAGRRSSLCCLPRRVWPRETDSSAGDSTQCQSRSRSSMTTNRRGSRWRV